MVSLCSDRTTGRPAGRAERAPLSFAARKKKKKPLTAVLVLLSFLSEDSTDCSFLFLFIRTLVLLGMKRRLLFASWTVRVAVSLLPKRHINAASRVGLFICIEIVVVVAVVVPLSTLSTEKGTIIGMGDATGQSSRRNKFSSFPFDGPVQDF